MMITDAPSRKANHRAGFLESDRIRTLDLPQDECLLTISQSIESALKTGTTADVRRTCAEFLDAASEFYKVPACGIRVLAARPLRVRENWSSELFGDYTPEAMLIRVWMKTAVRKEVTSLGTFLSTLCHEFCHHLDFQRFGFPDSWHTRGFYERAAALYHCATRNTAKAPFLGGSKGRSLEDRLAEDKQKCVTDRKQLGSLLQHLLNGDSRKQTFLVIREPD